MGKRRGRDGGRGGRRGRRRGGWGRPRQKEGEGWRRVGKPVQLNLNLKP